MVEYVMYDKHRKHRNTKPFMYAFANQRIRHKQRQKYQHNTVEYDLYLFHLLVSFALIVYLSLRII